MISAYASHVMDRIIEEVENEVKPEPVQPEGKVFNYKRLPDPKVEQLNALLLTHIGKMFFRHDAAKIANEVGCSIATVHVYMRKLRHSRISGVDITEIDEVED